MFKAISGAILVIGLAGGASLATTGTANAAGIGISFDVGNVAFGYQDGYWDRNHRWHRWHNEEEMRRYRAAHADGYHDWKHDRDPDHGWHH